MKKETGFLYTKKTREGYLVTIFTKEGLYPIPVSFQYKDQLTGTVLEFNMTDKSAEEYAKRIKLLNKE